jgi:hypothetical protein
MSKNHTFVIGFHTLRVKTTLLRIEITLGHMFGKCFKKSTRIHVNFTHID